MKKMSETIVFFGSGPVAAESLRKLTSNFKIEAVITKPKPAHHRGESPVLDVAEEFDIQILTAANKQELSGLIARKKLNSRLAVLVDFGIIVAQDVIDYFPLGIVNSHFSLLPEWRGADPITFAILSGQPKTGVSLMIIDAGMDTGKLLTQKGLAISKDETTATLTKKLIKLSDELLSVYLPSYTNSRIRPRSQPHQDRATYSRKLTKEDGVLDWQKPAAQLEREIRAFIEWPKSRTKIAGKEIVVTKARISDASGQPGKIEVRGKDIIVFCGENALIIERLKPAGKNEMTSEAFLAGHRHLL